MFGSDVQYQPLVPLDKGAQAAKSNGRKYCSVIFKFWMVSLILGGCVYLVDYFELHSLALRSLTQRGDIDEWPPQLATSLKGYLINTPGCRIPNLDPFDSTVKKFIFPPKKLKCDEKTAPLFESNLTSLYMLPSALPQYNVTNSTELKCCYTVFTREEPTDKQGDGRVKYEKKCTEINNSLAVDIKNEFIKVTCKNQKGKEVYEDYFVFVPLKKNISDPSKPNILIVGLDAISRVNLHRQLPKTYEYLTKELDSIELLGYNKVADNTFPNLIPVFTGMFEKEISNTCWPKSSAHFDKCPFLWTNFSENGYVTTVGEDCGWMGLFNYQKRGFKKQTADYYYTTFSRELESKIGTNKDFNCVECVGGRETYRVTVDYIRKFTARMNQESTTYFAFFWSNSLSHDYLNRPSLGDPSYYDLFNELNKTGVLNNTILIFMSDHGIRWGDIRKTYQGQMEERLPFVIMTLPKLFKETYPIAAANLKKNVRRLTTPFDLHETLKALLHVDNLKNSRTVVNEPVSRGYSLFNEIPKSRTCEDAEIVSHWCTCQQSNAIDSKDSNVVSAANFAVNNMNLQLQGYAQCATLVLDTIISARVLAHDSEHITNEKSIKDYTITLRTTPGDGVFEVTVRSRAAAEKATKSVVEWDYFNITGTISRLNLYGKQSYCITDFHLKLYCYCNSLI